ncbi:MAG: hypothetical protein M3Y26_04540 [Actinomycetota bacterium]|nr:hypothetical protein [Actinomycetota bacterium]
MTLVIVLVVLALLLGGVALAVKALWWVAILALVLFVVAAITGTRRY